MTEKGPLIISARPILTSNDGGPSRGILIMGRFFHDTLLKQLEWQTQVKYAVLPASDVESTPETKDAYHRLSNSNPHLMDDSEPGWMKVHSFFSDINGKTALLLTTKTPRSIAKKGHDTVQIAVYSVLIAGLGILLMILLNSEKLSSVKK